MWLVSVTHGISSNVEDRSPDGMGGCNLKGSDFSRHVEFKGQINISLISLRRANDLN